MRFLPRIFQRKKKLSQKDLEELKSITDCLNSQECRSLENNLEGIIKKLTKYVKKHPANAYLHQLLASAAFMNGDNQLADQYFDKAIELKIQDGGYSLLSKAYANMFDGYCTYDAVSSLRNLINEKEEFKNQMSGQVRSGLFLQVNEHGFHSYLTDLRNSATMAEVYYCFALTSYDFGERYEGLEYLEKAILLQPDNQEFKEKHSVLKKELNQ